jgi:hypothetical protein
MPILSKIARRPDAQLAYIQMAKGVPCVTFCARGKRDRWLDQQTSLIQAA